MRSAPVGARVTAFLLFVALCAYCLAPDALLLRALPRELTSFRRLTKFARAQQKRACVRARAR
eukprot:12614264-Alexandrium_andersonii.AAC.1